MPVAIRKDKGEAGEWRWHAIGDNGEPMAHGEGHTSSRDALRAWERLVDLAAKMEVTIDHD